MGLMLVSAIMLAILPIAAGTAYSTVAVMYWVQSRSHKRDHAGQRDPVELARDARARLESRGTLESSGAL
ncbi:hypothetical protein [Nocardia sp. BMG51109]|uniref:hypothetical protein n=1 Tax=Nocardia sp. BMG51109 TaxID=1056816 RepID=UPI0004B45DF6|nr:hypothetical protein [Nocardia sp. BMG51109]